MKEIIEEDLIGTIEDDSDQDLYVHHDILVDKGQEAMRIDKFLMGRLERVSRNKVQNSIRAGAIIVNELPVKPNYKVRPGDRIKVVLSWDPDANQEIQPEDIPIKIIYEDDAVMVIDKPAGLVVHPGIGNYSGTLVNALVHHFTEKTLPVLPKNPFNRPGLVHRIDKDTTGLMVIAKTEYAMSHLAKQFFDHTVDRNYHALVWGNFEVNEGTITGHLARNPGNRFQMIVFPEGDVGKHAVTHYKVLHDYYYVSLVECKLETGRTHQIRAHMKHMGHPLFGDDRYGGDQIMKGTVYSKYKQFVKNCFDLCSRQCLHAKTLGFTHPETGERMTFDSELPEDMRSVIAKWSSYFTHKKDLP